MRHSSLFAGVLLLGITATSCGTTTMEDRFVQVLSESICIADEAYRAIESVREPSSGTGAVLSLREKADEVSRKLDIIRTTAFGSEAQLLEEREKLENKKQVADRAIAIAKSKCAPSDRAIEQATKDYQ